MTASTDTELDQQTRDELQPGCDLPRDSQPCPEPAAWIVWVVSVFGPTPKVLACQDHKEKGEDHFASCGLCRTLSRYHAEPLR